MANENPALKLNWLDRTIGIFSPSLMLSRMKTRYVADLIARRYDGASRSPRTAGWNTQPTSANAEVYRDLHVLRDRSRDLVRNNSYANRAVSVITSNTIGTGIRTTLKSKNVPQKKIDIYKGEWTQWSETTDIDADGRHDFYGLQSLVLRGVVESGEVFVRRRRRRPSDGLDIPLQIQVLEPDFVVTWYNQIIETGRIIQGIEFDKLGNRVAYYMYKQHPGDSPIGRGYEQELVRVLAEDVIHVYRMDRPGQIRGVPWAAPAMMKLRDFDDYQDATILRQKIAACYAAFVIDQNPSDVSLLTSDSNKQVLPESIRSGMVERLGVGQDIKFSSPPSPDDQGFTRTTLLGIAIAFGVPYETFGDLSTVNFSSGRMGWLEFQRNLEQWRWLMMIPQFCNGVYGWFQEAALLSGYRQAPAIQAKWTPPAREMIDPVAETNAIVKQVRSGITSLGEAIREQGRDPDEVLQEIKDCNDQVDQLGLVLDSDPRKITGNGIVQPIEKPKNPENNSDATN